MWNKSDHQIDLEKLDRFGEELLQALEASDAEINQAAASPFLYRRILVRIESERKRRSEEWNKWLTLLKEMRHAIPVFAIIAIIVAAFVWRGTAQVAPSPAINNISSLQLISSSETLPMSGDEVITSVVDWKEHTSNQRREQQ